MKMLKFVLLIAILFRIRSFASATSDDFKLTTLVPFNGENGSMPEASLIQDGAGNFYGTTSAGGKSNLGTVFKMCPSGELTVLASFNGTNGATPYSSLTLGPDGCLYGTTYYGGNYIAGFDGYGAPPNGVGTVFKITTNGVFTPLVYFNVTNGANPQGALVLATDGNFYGTTRRGGTINLPYDFGGTVFKMTPNGVLTTLISFNGTNGVNPNGLIQGQDGDFYGTTSFGVFFYDDTNYYDSPGTVFKMDPEGTLTTLVSFDSYGQPPSDFEDLVQTADGTLYGATVNSIFEVMSNSSLLIAASLESSNGFSLGNLVVGNDDALYGTASGGGNGYGTIFKMTTNDTISTLVLFVGTNEGFAPSGLTLGKDGRFYGAAPLGNAVYSSNSPSFGTIFRLSTAQPVIRFVAPTRNTPSTNADVTIRGKARGRDGVAKVLYESNTNGWIEANTSDYWTNWTAIVTLSPGTNEIHAYAVSSASLSRTNRLKVIRAN